jgi:hypothetical protein
MRLLGEVIPSPFLVLNMDCSELPNQKLVFFRKVKKIRGLCGGIC